MKFRVTILDIFEVSIGDCKGLKKEYVPLFVKVDEKKLVLGSLQSEDIPQFGCDLVFEKDFELSHNWTKGSVYFVGYKSPNLEEEYP